MSKREKVGKNMLEKQIYFWFQASVASFFPKSSIGRRIYFALFHIDLHETFYPYILPPTLLYTIWISSLASLPLCVFFRLQEFPSPIDQPLFTFRIFPLRLAPGYTSSCLTSIATLQASICRRHFACVPKPVTHQYVKTTSEF